MRKRGLEFSFAWIFAIIAGAVIIFLAIYATTNIITSTRYETDTETAAQLEVLLNPIETNLESGKLVEIGFSDETRVFPACKDEGRFGRQEIRTSTRSGIGKEWGSPGGAISSNVRYIMAERQIEGRQIHVFSKPINMPYKIGDIMIIYSDEYCFINPREEIEDEINSLGLPGITINSSVRNCPRESRKICFEERETGCEVVVYENTLSKDGKNIYYEEEFIMGAIFSDPDNYECQIKRIAARASYLAEVYISKSEYLSSKGCASGLEEDLEIYSEYLDNLDSSVQLSSAYGLSNSLGRKNEALKCKLF